MRFLSCNFKANHHGNVLFLILIAVALFASLAYVVTNSSRVSSSSSSREKTKLLLSEIENYAISLQQAATRLKTTGGCTSEQLSFESDSWGFSSAADNYANNNAPSDNRCHIFHPDGGAVPFQQPPDALRDTNNQYNMNTVNMANIGTSRNDGTVFVIVDRDTCIKANEKYSNENPSNEPPIADRHYNIIPGFDGTSSTAYSTGCCGKTDPFSVIGPALGVTNRAIELAGEYSGCFQEQHSTDQNYLLYHVIVPN